MLWRLVLCKDAKGRDEGAIIRRSLDCEIRRDGIGRFRRGQPGSIGKYGIEAFSSRVRTLGGMEARKPTVE